MARTYLVTGGLGFIGAALCRALLQAGHRVRILDNLSRGKRERLDEPAAHCETIIGDIRNPDVVDGAVRGVDAVCHLAAINGTRNFYEQPKLVLEVAVKGTLHVLDACQRHGVGELVLTSSSEVYQTPPVIPTPETVPLTIPDPHNPRYSYAGGKIISELLAINYGRERWQRVVIVRPHNVYGPDMGWKHVIPEFAARLLPLRQPNGPDRPIAFPIQGDGRQTRSFIYVDDFIDGLLRVIDHGRHLNIYNIGTTDERSIREVAERTAGALGLTIHVVSGPEAVGGTSRRCPDVTKVQQLGFTPRVPFLEGLRRTVSWCTRHWVANSENGERLAG